MSDEPTPASTDPAQARMDGLAQDRLDDLADAGNNWAPVQHQPDECDPDCTCPTCLY